MHTMESDGTVNCQKLRAIQWVAANAFYIYPYGLDQGLAQATITATGAISGASVAVAGGIGANGVTPPTQPALPITLADVIAILVGSGLCAAS